MNALDLVIKNGRAATASELFLGQLTPNDVAAKAATSCPIRFPRLRKPLRCEKRIGMRLISSMDSSRACSQAEVIAVDRPSRIGSSSSSDGQSSPIRRPD